MHLGRVNWFFYFKLKESHSWGREEIINLLSGTNSSSHAFQQSNQEERPKDKNI